MKVLDQITQVKLQFLATLAGEEQEESDDLFASLFDEQDEEEDDVDIEETDEVTPEPTDDGDQADVEEVKDEPQQKPVVEQPKGQDTPEPKDAPKPKVEEPVVKQETKPKEEEKPFDVEAYKGELQKLYALSKDDADALLTDPETVLPKLMANAHLQMLNHIGQFVQAQMQQLPTVVKQTVESSTVEKQRLSAFAEAHPDLVTDEAAPFVVQAITALKQAKPDITFDEIVKRVKPVAYTLMGKEMPTQQLAPVQQPVTKPKPFVPGRPTSVAPSKVPQSKEAEFFQSLLED